MKETNSRIKILKDAVKDNQTKKKMLKINTVKNEINLKPTLKREL